MSKELLDLTSEQITIYNTCHRKAVEYFESIGLLPLDREPYEYALHHKDETLRHTDVDRYIQWRIDDLEVVKTSEHVSNHMIGNNNASGKRSDESRAKMSAAQMGNTNGHGNAGRKQSEEEIQTRSSAIREAYQNPEARENVSKANKKRYENPEERKKTSEAIKLWWQRRKEDK